MSVHEHLHIRQVSFEGFVSWTCSPVLCALTSQRPFKGWQWFQHSAPCQLPMFSPNRHAYLPHICALCCFCRRNHILFGGTRILQHTGDKAARLKTPDGGCLVIVLRTGKLNSRLWSAEAVHAILWFAVC